MVTVTESPVDLDNAVVLGTFEHSVLVSSLRTAIDRAEDAEAAAEAAGAIGAEVVHRMTRNAAADLLAALEHRTVVLADLVLDLG